MSTILCDLIINPCKENNENIEKAYAYLCNSAIRSLLKSSLPSLKENWDIDDNDIFFKYLRWLYVRNIQSDWRISIALLYYLREMNLNITDELEIQCLLSSCSQWTYFDKTKKRIIAIQEYRNPKKLYVEKKVFMRN